MSVSTVLTATVGPTDTSISVDDGTISPPAQFPIVINGEQMNVIDGFGTDTWAVQRDEALQTVLVAEDDFARVVYDAWGPNAAGQEWKNAVNGSSRVFAVNDGNATIEDSNVSGVGIAPRLPTVPLQLNAEATIRFIIDSVADTADTQIGLRVRELDNSTHDRYFARAVVKVTSNDMTVRLIRRVNGVDGNVSSLVTKSALFAVDTWYVLRVQAIGSNPTTLNGKLWKESEGEPAGWDVAGTDSTAGLQVPGYPALYWELGAGATNTPVTVGFADFKYLRIPTGRSHPSGSVVTLIEPWELPIAVLAEPGEPLTAPPSGALQVQTDVTPPILWARVGSEWHPIRVDDAPSFVSTAKWGNS